jgi:hypothetical protein
VLPLGSLRLKVFSESITAPKREYHVETCSQVRFWEHFQKYLSIRLLFALH